ncbi:MAG: phosphoglycerate kinase [Bacteriovoracaceae bacterium]
MAIQFIDSADALEKIGGKNVLARFDFNVPLHKENGTITDTTRVDRALETIKLILEQKPKKLILMSHLGRPKGESNPKFSLEPVAGYLAEKLEQDVTLTESATDASIKTLLSLQDSQVILLENLRFHKEETDCDSEFAKKIASYGDIFVHDAFGTAHRKHASTYEIIRYFPRNAYAGLLLKKEILALSKVVETPESPFVAIVGGAKVSDKIKILESLLPNVDSLLIGGAMAYPFLKAKGFEVGKSLCLDEDVELAKRLLKQSTASKIILPVDHIASDSPDGEATKLNDENIPDDLMALDIGERTLALYSDKLASAKTVLWNGPMGFFEKENFAKGSFGVAEALAKLDSAFTLVGGGDSVSAVMKSGLASKISHISTGGGASLEFIENGTLPGIQALKFGLN